MSFIDDNHGWVLGAACDARGNCRPGIARTDDGGASWSLLPFPSEEELGVGSIYFSSIDDGWLIDPSLAETTDGGDTWTSVNPPGAALVAGVVSFDGSAWAVSGCVACGTTIWESPAPGSPFEPAPSQPPNPTGTNASFTQAMVAGSHLILSGPMSGGEIAASPDGRSWELADLPSACVGDDQLGASPAGTLLDVCAVEVGGGFAPKEAWTSTDWGSHWTLLSRSMNWPPPSGAAPIGQIPAWGYPNDIAMPTSLDAWMSMDREDMYETHDGGVTWTASAVPGEFGGNAAGAGQVTFVDATHGWALSAEGLYGTTDGSHWAQITVLGPVPGAAPSPSSGRRMALTKPQSWVVSNDIPQRRPPQAVGGSAPRPDRGIGPACPGASHDPGHPNWDEGKVATILILATVSSKLGSTASPTGEHRGQVTPHSHRRAFLL
jgi:photosystem II stability/assembly factor-like uncharacterized protein